MDPRHRDRIAFVRVCSGRFEKDMVLPNSRVGKPLRASRAYRFFGRDRETIDVAYAGDILGLVNPGQFAIGDTVHTGQPLSFFGVPRFPAEHFGRVRLKDTRYKQFDEGLRQLEEEGLMQVFYTASGRREPIVGVVGRFSSTSSRAGCAASTTSRSSSSRPPSRRRDGWPIRAKFTLGGQGALATDRLDRKVILFSSPWELEYFQPPAPRRRAARRIAAVRLIGIPALMIAFSGINKQYGKQVLFVDASFQLNEGEKVGLVGPNGSGKTTLFRMIVGEEQSGRRRRVGPAQGDRRLFPPGRRRDVGPLGARRGDCRQRPPRRASSRARRAAARDVGSRRRPTRWTRSSSASATCRKSTNTWAAMRSRAGRARSCTVSASTTSGLTAMSARCRAAGRCASPWRACCSASQTSC